MFRLPIVKFFNRIFNRVTITVVLVALQVLWLLWAFWSFTAGRVWLNGALKALSILIVLYLVRKDENSAYKIGWIVLIGLLPLLGGALYLAFGNKAPAKHLRAANIINQYMGAFLSLTSTPEEEEGEVPSIFAPEGQESNAELDKQIEDLDLSVRSYNCLKRAGIHSVRQLVEFSENDLLNIRNFGAKSIEEVKDKLISMDLNLKQ